MLRRKTFSILFIVKRLQFVVNHIGSGFTMNGLDKPAVFTISIADLIALAPWIRSPAGFNFNGDGSSDRQPQILAPPRARGPPSMSGAVPRILPKGTTVQVLQ